MNGKLKGKFTPQFKRHALRNRGSLVVYQAAVRPPSINTYWTQSASVRVGKEEAVSNPFCTILSHKIKISQRKKCILVECKALWVSRRDPNGCRLSKKTLDVSDSLYC